MSQKKTTEREWAERCAASSGQMFMCPTELVVEHKELWDEANKLDAKAADVNRESQEFAVKMNAHWLKVRNALADKHGNRTVYDSGVSIGTNADAKKDGVVVINVVKNER